MIKRDLCRVGLAVVVIHITLGHVRTVLHESSLVYVICVNIN